ncbi:N-acetyl-1-D-myo-inositol-2-amino-2-deoxy-alpha-D-glucopyranoside deacetylase [Nakamurella sp. A5-74]|uniref:N-acetyl-1-D-myo-inositol-2-amino-2-deoxy-alpha-D-glucopyranoside deacetylase n=1 Tax=Nakamurella sp. A5-74 TaxID=3158264 RepID=A0AAU8DQL6_9ACTN
MTDRRLMLVHAHPDDETSSTAATMADAMATGGQVTLVTCTLGERGSVVLPELLHLHHEQDDGLGPHRLGELAAAMGALGVTDFVRLGGDGRWSDSGMVDTDEGLATVGDDVPENAFWNADLLEAATELVALIRDRRPQVLITYDEKGGYGHPDHVQAHRVAMYATALAGALTFRPDLGAAWTIQRVLWTAIPASAMRMMIAGARAAGEEFFAGFDLESDAIPPMCVADEYIAVKVDGSAYRRQRFAALRAHRTQIPADSFFFWGEHEESGVAVFAAESFTLAAGSAPPPGATDVFAGLLPEG